MSDAYGLLSCKCNSASTSPCPLSGWALVDYIFFCHLMWWMFYWFLVLITRQSAEWCCRLLTFLHGCIVSFSALHDLYVNKDTMAFQNSALSEAQKNYLSVLLSYFIFDFSWIVLFGNEAWIIYCHHLTSIFILSKIFMGGFGGKIVSYAVAGLEFTNPYLQARWCLRTQGYLNTRIHKWVELWFFISFLTIRLIGGTILLNYAMHQSSTDFILKLSFLCMYGVSLVLAYQIVTYFAKKYLDWPLGRRVTTDTSRVSISLYFQQRTLDTPSAVRENENYSRNNDEENVASEETRGENYRFNEKYKTKKSLNWKVHPISKRFNLSSKAMKRRIRYSGRKNAYTFPLFKKKSKKMKEYFF